MKASRSDTDGKLNGVFQERYKDGTEGKFADNQKIGEWSVYDAQGKLIKTTQHKARDGKL